MVTPLYTRLFIFFFWVQNILWRNEAFSSTHLPILPEYFLHRIAPGSSSKKQSYNFETDLPSTMRDTEVFAGTHHSFEQDEFFAIRELKFISFSNPVCKLTEKMLFPSFAKTVFQNMPLIQFDFIIRDSSVNLDQVLRKSDASFFSGKYFLIAAQVEGLKIARGITYTLSVGSWMKLTGY